MLKCPNYTNKNHLAPTGGELGHPLRSAPRWAFQTMPSEGGRKLRPRSAPRLPQVQKIYKTLKYSKYSSTQNTQTSEYLNTQNIQILKIR